MKAIIEFNLPEESQEHLAMLNSGKVYAALDAIRNDVFRKNRKYGMSEELKGLTPEELLYALEDQVNDIILSYGLDLC